MVENPESQGTFAKPRLASLEARLLGGLVPSFVLFGLSIVQAGLLVPVLLSVLGKERYAIWILISSTATVFQSVDAGFHYFMGNEFNGLYAKSLSRLREQAASTVKVAYILAGGGIVAGLCFAWSPYWPALLPAESTSGLIGEARLAFLALVVAWALQGTMSGLLVKLYTPFGLYARGQWWGVAYRISQLVFLIGTACLTQDLLVIALSTGVVAVVQGWLLLADCHRLLGSHFSWWGGRIRDGLMNLLKSLSLSAATFAEGFLQTAVLAFVASNFTGAGVAAFVTLRTMVNVVAQAASLLIGPLVPDLVRYVIQREERKQEDIMQVMWLFLVGGGAVVLAVLNIFAEPLYRLWTRNLVEFDSLLLVCLMISALLKLTGLPCSTYLRSLNLNGAVLIGLVLQAFLLVTIGAVFDLGHQPLHVAALALAAVDFASALLWPFGCMLFFENRRGLSLSFRPLIFSVLLVAVLAAAWLAASKQAVSSAVVVLGQGLAMAVFIWAMWCGLSGAARVRLISLLESRGIRLKLGSSA